MKRPLILVLTALMTAGCTVPRNEEGIAILTSKKAQRYIQQVERAAYINGAPDLDKLREFVLTHPDTYKVYEWNGPGYEGFLGGVFVLHVSQDVPESDHAELDALMDELRREFMKRQQ